MSTAGLPAEVWMIVALIAACLVAVTVRTLGEALRSQISAHDLQVRARQLRLEQRRSRQAFGDPIDADAREAADVDPASEPEPTPAADPPWDAAETPTARAA